jgi:hypothetical protein
VNKIAKDKIIAQCKDELKRHYVLADVFTYSVCKDDLVYHVSVKKNGKLFYEISDIICDDDFDFIQWNMQIHDGRW